MVNQSFTFFGDILSIYFKMKAEKYMYRYHFLEFWNEKNYWEFLQKHKTEESFRQWLEWFVELSRCISYKLFCQALDCFAEHLHYLHGEVIDFGGIVTEFKAKYVEGKPHCYSVKEPLDQFPRHWQVDW